MIRRDRYSSISLDLLVQYRTVLSRRTDSSGSTSWTAKVVGMPWCEASGSTRTEALRRVREMAAGKGSSARAALGSSRDAHRTPAVEAGAPAQATARGRVAEGAQSLDT